ncbi:Hypothetical protein CINCED_3A017598 [Cinara cedri]|uniref:Pre-C2HC domain-containing protein n=1 Tax=Cinara cedri TaxID=506608 RepID=A0A5E4MTR8_9HEMI|nr:Hypothetical protein CINCED_3A017598 [Cinara cedri]
MPKSPNVQTNNINNSTINNKKKKTTIIQDAHLNSPSNKPDSNSMNNDGWLTQINKYDPFETTSTTKNIPNSPKTNTDAETIIIKPPPPPIFAKGIEDYPELCTTLIELIGVDNFMYKSTTNSLKIQIKDPSAYRTLIQFLKTEKAEYHTYQLKEDKPFRVVICNLHSSMPLTLIKDELDVCCFESHINQKQSPNFSTANNTDTLEHTVVTIPGVFIVGRIISHLHTLIHEMSQNASIVFKVTQPIIKAAQSIKIFNVEKHPVY